MESLNLKNGPANRTHKFNFKKLIPNIFQTIKHYEMIQKGDAVLIGVSGGPDSMALLHALLYLAEAMDLRLGVAHLNHCLRQASSDADEQFVASAAKKLTVPVFVEKKDIVIKSKKTGLGLEEAGREARYHFFNQVCEKHRFDKIAVGHHGEDNAEQVLLNLVRGSGPAGMGGIPPVRKNIIRPLIRTPRSEILNYLNENKIEYVVDPSNADDRFLRNKIRHHLMPLLHKTYNPKISETLNRLSAIVRSEEAWINALITPLFETVMVSADDRQMILSVSGLRQFHAAARRRILRKAIETIKKDLRRITCLHIEAMMRLISTNPAKARLDLPGRIRILKRTDQLIIVKESKNLRMARPPEECARPVVFEYSISRAVIESGESVYIHEIDRHISFYKTDRRRIQTLTGQENHTAFFDWDTLAFPIMVRNFRPGDRFSPMGMTGTQKLKKFFTNNKIKHPDRLTLPIFVSNDKIIWVGGIRMAEGFKITPRTQTVLRIQISSSAPSVVPGEDHRG